jgi:hypothetical protein
VHLLRTDSCERVTDFATMAPRKRRTDTNPHTKLQQDDMIMECIQKFPPIGGTADGVMGKRKQLVRDPQQVAAMQQLPQVKAFITESTPDAKLRAFSPRIICSAIGATGRRPTREAIRFYPGKATWPFVFFQSRHLPCRSSVVYTTRNLASGVLSRMSAFTCGNCCMTVT